jgi:hypothetical protein
MLDLILGGAALQRCGKCIILDPALAAEDPVCCPGMSFLTASRMWLLARTLSAGPC